MALGAAEDDGLATALSLQDATNNFIFIESVCAIDELLDVGLGVTFVWLVCTNVHRLVLVFASQGNDRAGHRCREQHGLAVSRGIGEESLNVWQEAEVKHLVGFVKNHELDVAEVQLALLA